MLFALRSTLFAKNIDHIYILTNDQRVNFDLPDSLPEPFLIDIDLRAPDPSVPQLSEDLPVSRFLAAKLDIVLRKSWQFKFMGREENLEIRDALQREIAKFGTSFTDIDLSLQFLKSRKFNLTTLQAIKNVIGTWPESREKLYETRVEELALDPELEDIRPWCKLALSWVLYSCRPLRVKELAVALALDPNDTQYHILADKTSRSMQSDLERHLGVFLRFEGGEVRSLSSETELRNALFWLENSKKVESSPSQPSAHAQLAIVCIHYIRMVLLQGAISDKWDECVSQASCAWEYDNVTSDNPDGSLALLDYALRFWPHHYAQACAERSNCGRDSLDLDNIVLKFLKDDSLRSRWFHLYLVATSNSNGHGTESHFPTSYVHSGDIIQISQSDVSHYFGFSSIPDAEKDTCGSPALPTENKSSGEAKKTDNIEGLHRVQATRGAFHRTVRFSDVSTLEFAKLFFVHGDTVSLDTLPFTPSGPFPNECAIRIAAQGCGSLEIIKKLAKLKNALNNDSPNINDERRTMLHSAIIGGNPEVFSHVLAEYIDKINATDANGEAPLAFAAKLRNRNAMKLLLESQCDLDAQNIKNDRRTALHFATCAGPSFIKEFSGYPVKFKLDSNGESPIHLAVRTGCVDTVKALLELARNLDPKRGLENFQRFINGSNKSGQTAIDLAITCGHLDVVKVFKSYTNIMIETSVEDESETSIEIAAGRGHLRVLEEICNSQDIRFQRLFRKACGSGQLLVFKYLLGLSPLDDNTARARNTKENLIIAAKRGYPEVAKLLLTAKVDANVEDDEQGKTPLHYASRNGQAGFAELLIRYDADIEATDNESLRPLHAAIEGGRSSVVKLLLDKGAYPANGPERKSVFHLGVKYPDIISLLHKRLPDISIDAFDNKERTPLVLASMGGFAESVRVLLEAKADPNAAGDDNRIPLYYAVQNSHRDVVDELLKTSLSKKMSALIRTVRNTDIFQQILPTITKSLLAEDFKKVEEAFGDQLRGWYGGLLHRAVRLNSEALGHMLGEPSGLWTKFLDRKDREGRTPFFSAAYGGRVDSAKVLIGAGADIYQRSEDPEGWYPLHAGADNLEITKLLVSKSADINVLTGDSGKTPTSLAAGWGKDDVVKFLLDEGADINLLDENKQTALHYGGRLERETLERLVDGTSDLERVSKDGMTYMHRAIEADNEHMVEILCTRGMNVQSLDTGGLSYLEFAANSGKPRSLGRLLEISKGNQIWGLETKINAFRICCQKSFDPCVEKLLCHVEEVRETEIFEAYVPKNSQYDFGVELLERETYDPFKLWGVHRDRLSGFQRAIISRDNILENFIERCLAKVPNDLSSFGAGFKELRNAIELQKKNMWEKFESLREKASNHRDDDGWSLDDFLHQAGGGAPAAAKSTFMSTLPPPTSFLVPNIWKMCIFRNPDGLSSQQNPRLSIDPTASQIVFTDCPEQPPDRRYTNIRSERPFPPRSPEYNYFEIKIQRGDTVGDGSTSEDLNEVENASSDEELASDSEGTSSSSKDSKPMMIGIGLCGEFSYLENAVVGHNLWSIGYHSDDGTVYLDGKSVKSSSHFGFGDTVGCGVDIDTGECIFILNGKVSQRVKSDLILRKIYPVITYSGGDGSTRISYKFGSWKQFYPEIGLRREERERREFEGIGRRAFWRRRFGGRISYPTSDSD
ncbi:hypothetical protein TWF481_003333 [Arthrobotrys musiformis]|uniref:B30.2/SPRY domain-containing protein n=1 Tax=Arthrobotrys musiformis TaxID=47236 RepID=A0AAV9VQ71_9PEZI